MSHKSHASQSRATTRLGPEEDPEFQIAPMIDILLVLLVFFMSISTSEILQLSRGVILPVAEERLPSDRELIVNVLWNPINNAGRLEIGTHTYASADQIKDDLTAAMRDNPNTRILIRADRNVRFEYLRTVMKAAGESGVSKITFSVVNREE